MQTAATYFDGRSASSVDGTLEISGQSIRFRADAVEKHIAIAKSRLVQPVGRGPWTIEIFDGSSVRVHGDAPGASLAAAYGHSTFVRRLEKSWPWAVTAIVVAVAGSWAFLTFGVPVIAREVAFALPDDIHATLGSRSLSALDDFLFEESQLATKEQRRIRRAFEEIPGIEKKSNSYQLHFRASPKIGANAFAIPGGNVVITDEMIELTESDDEIVGVLAHEVGHLAHRHGLRIILQDSLSALLVAALTGDLTNISALSAAVPTALMQAKYSRDFEREADAYAFAYLEANGRDTRVLARLLVRVEEAHGMGGDAGWAEWFSSHPPSEARRPDQRDR